MGSRGGGGAWQKTEGGWFFWGGVDNPMYTMVAISGCHSVGTSINVVTNNQIRF